MKIEGLDELAKYLGKSVPDMIDAAIARVVKTVADALVNEMKSMVPVQSGALKNSIKWDQVEEEVEVIVGASYGYFVEFGTVDTPPNPFFYPSVDAFRFRMQELLTKELERLK